MDGSALLTSARVPTRLHFRVQLHFPRLASSAGGSVVEDAIEFKKFQSSSRGLTGLYVDRKKIAKHGKRSWKRSRSGAGAQHTDNQGAWPPPRPCGCRLPGTAHDLPTHTFTPPTRTAASHPRPRCRSATTLGNAGTRAAFFLSAAAHALHMLMHALSRFLAACRANPLLRAADQKSPVQARCRQR